MNASISDDKATDNNDNNKLLRIETLDKASMTEPSSYCAMPVNLAISLGEGGQISRIGNSSAVIIGEFPSNLNDIYNEMIRKPSEANISVNLKQLVENQEGSASSSSVTGIKSKVLPFLRKQTEKFVGAAGKAIKEEIEDVKELEGCDESGVKEEPVREQWTRKTEFLLAIIGFSVDLGNIWRFPKVVYENGGGRFLIPYFVQLALCGLPLFYMELVLGQFHQTGLFTMWEKICPILKGLAVTVMIINLFMAMFYNTVISWAVYYLLLSFNTQVPWKGCDNPWNTICCFPINDMAKVANVHNYTYNEGVYQRRGIDSLIFHNQKTSLSDIKRLLVFDTKYQKTNKSKDLRLIFEGVGRYFSYKNLTFPSLNSSHEAPLLAVSDEDVISRLVSAYYVLSNSEVRGVGRPFIPLNEMAKYAHDSGILSDLIESQIARDYKNKSYEIIVNCAQLMNNPTQEFYTRHLTELHRSTGLNDLAGIKWELVGCLLLVFVSVYFALWKGIKSAGKAVWITATMPYIVMFILLIRGFTLEGSSIGIDFYLRIDDWSSLADMKVWIDAAAQIFFSLGPGFGTIIALSSYNKKSNNIYKDALLTSLINSLTSILSGFVVFSTLGHMAFIQGKSIHDVVEPGPGLIFVTYPQAISMMPFSPFWAIIFFFMLFTLGIDSTFGGLESVITAVCDYYPNQFGGKNRSWFVLGLLVLCFIGALPTVTYGGSYIVHLFDNYTVAPSILLVAFLEAIAVFYVYGCERFCADLYEMIQIKPSKFWIICWKYVSPFFVLVMVIMICKAMLTYPLTFGDYYTYEGLGSYLAVLIVCGPLSLMPVYAMWRVHVSEGSTYKEKFMKALRPADHEAWRSANLNRLNNLSDDFSDLKLQKIKKAKYVIINFNNNNDNYSASN